MKKKKIINPSLRLFTIKLRQFISRIWFSVNQSENKTIYSNTTWVNANLQVVNKIDTKKRMEKCLDFKKTRHETFFLPEESEKSRGLNQKACMEKGRR